MIQPVMTPETADVFSLTISRDVDQEFSVRSVDILGRNMRHRISFTSASGIYEVFERELADCIRAVLDRLPMKAHVYSDPDFVIELPGLTLARLRVLIKVVGSGAAQIIMRFRYFIGSLQSAFRVDTHLSLPTVEHREKIAIETLSDIATPIFSLALAGSKQIEKSKDLELVLRKLENLSERASELNFYLSLLTRYVSECSRISSEPQPQAIRIAASNPPQRHSG
ncbi:MAG: hypothetical protein AAGG56_02730 [Pseudomonadota bacterium]